MRIIASVRDWRVGMGNSIPYITFIPIQLEENERKDQDTCASEVFLTGLHVV